MLLATVAVGVAVLALLKCGEIRELRDRLRSVETRLRALQSQPTDEVTPTGAEGIRTPEPPPPPPTAEPVPAARELVATLSESDPEPVEEPTPREAWTIPEPEPSQPKTGIEWERWLGVRGFAVVGGIVLALAAILLFQHAASRGWVTPWVRVPM